MPTKFGIPYEEVTRDNPSTSTFKPNRSDTTLTTLKTAGTQTITLNFDNTKLGDPDTVFNTETSVFQYFEDNYLENNPGTIDDVIISYVGDYWSDTVQGQHTQLDSEIEE